TFRLRGCWSTAGSFGLRALTSLGFCLQARIFLSLAASRFFSFLATALFLFGAALSLDGGQTAIFRLTHLGVLQGAATRFHLALRQLVQHDAGTRLLRARRLPARRRLRLLGRSGTRLWLRRRRCRRLWTSIRPCKLALLGFDDDSLRASMRKALPHSPLLGALERQRFLRIDAERLVFTSFTISHSISSAAPAAADAELS